MVCRIVSIVLLVLFISCPLYAGMWEEYMGDNVIIVYPDDTRELIQKIFPFLQILDEWVDLTGGVTFVTVGDKETGQVFDLYYWLGKWTCRQKDENGKYWFWKPTLEHIYSPTKWHWIDYPDKKEYKYD